MIAAIDGNQTLVAFLIQRGADVALRDSTGETARQLAEKHRHPEVAQLLEQAEGVKAGE